MYLSRLWLNPRCREARRDLLDAHELHRTVMRGFPRVEPAGDVARDHHAVLHRVDDDRRQGRLVLYVQSKTEPDWRALPEGYLIDTCGEVDNPATASLDAAWNALAPGTVLGFRLRANPTRKIDTKTGSDGKRRNGRRLAWEGEADQLAWLVRKAGRAGFDLCRTATDSAVPDVQVTEERKLIGRRPSTEGQKTQLTFAAVRFEGRLRVTNPQDFRAALASGIGPAKAYGFGLLSIAKAP